jgi:hypothetical protein
VGAETQFPVGELPGHLQPDRHRDLRGRDSAPWVRRAYLLVLSVFVVLALFDVFGQKPSTATSREPNATLSVESPTRLRGGLLYQVRITVQSRVAIDHPRIVLSPEWFEGMTLNTTEPAAESEGTREGAVTFTFPALGPGDSLVFFTEWQVNPTTVDSRTADVELDDGSTPITRVSRDLTIFP